MTHAYQEMYLSNAQALLGDAFDYAINACSSCRDGRQNANCQTAGNVQPFQRVLDWLGYRVLSMVLQPEIQRYFQGPFVRGFAADVRSASRSRHQQICRYCRCQSACVFYRYQSQTHPHDLRLHTSRACQAKRRQPPVDPDVRATQQGYQ